MKNHLEDYIMDYSIHSTTELNMAGLTVGRVKGSGFRGLEFRAY